MRGTSTSRSTACGRSRPIRPIPNRTMQRFAPLALLVAVLAAAGWLAVFVIRDARGYAVALGANATREVLDLVDLLFRVDDPSTGLYVMLPISATSLVVALSLSIRAIRNASGLVADDDGLIGQERAVELRVGTGDR